MMTVRRVEIVSGYLLYITLLCEGARICLFPPNSSARRQEWHRVSQVAMALYSGTQNNSSL